MRYNSGVCLSKTNIIKAGKDLFLYHRGKKESDVDRAENNRE